MLRINTTVVLFLSLLGIGAWQRTHIYYNKLTEPDHVFSVSKPDTVVTQKPLTLPPRDTDLSIRFQHLEPFYDAPDLAAHWSMDEGSGYECIDESGRGNTAYITGSNWNTKDSGLTASFRRKGKRAGCVYLNGTQWLQAKHQAPLNNTGQITIVSWIKPNGNIAALKGKTIVSKKKNNKGYEITAGQEGNICFSVYDDTSKEHRVCSKANSIATNQWTHIVGVSDASRGNSQMYINGKLSATVTEKPFTVSNDATDLMIGSTPGADGFKGWIDEVTIFSKDLTQQEAEELYAIGLPKIYTQTRQTVDENKSEWTSYKGNQPIPHPVEESTVFSLNFNGNLSSLQGQKPEEYSKKSDVYVPGAFGGAFDAVMHTKGLTYASPISTGRGTFQTWFIPVEDPKDKKRSKKHVLFRAEGKDARIELFSQNSRWKAVLGQKGKAVVALESPEMVFAYGKPIHLGVGWGKGEHQQEVVLFINGVAVAQKTIDFSPVFDKTVQISGKGSETAYGYVDDVSISSEVKDWRSVCPRGHTDTESPALDLMDDFDHEKDEPLAHWKPATQNAAWHYSVKNWEDDGSHIGDSGTLRRSLQQSNPKGLHPVFHPDAYGYMSSIEAGVSFDTIADGWVGIFTKSPNGPDFTGQTFMINPSANQIRLAAFFEGKMNASKVLPYDFTLKTQTTYTLTLTALDGILRGYIDGHNMISMETEGAIQKGFAGLLTENMAAHFDDVHFTALTPSTQESRKIQQRVFSDGTVSGMMPHYKKLTLNAFRWKKRYGLLPWHRTYKNPEPPGNIFGPTSDGVERPNPSQFWRSEDAANSDILKVDGKMYYFMRGNPDFNGPHGPASIGTLLSTANIYDGIHFQDQNADIKNLNQANLLRGHKDQSDCPDEVPRHTRFQVNDEGGVYLDGKILVFAREFKNPFAAFRRLIFGVYDIENQAWDQHVPHTVEWSQMNPDSCYAKITGLNATPEVTALREPGTDAYVIFLYHGRRTIDNVSTTGIIGLRYDGQNVHLHPDYPAKDSYTKHNEDVIYGERIFFDNGIYYMHVNAGSDKSKLKKDWPDRFQLFTSLHPYEGPWTGSAENTNTERPYFSRGDAFDPDNGAIWQGTMFKNKNRYYLYYENFHSIDDVNNPYDHYDATHSGSRVGFATGN